MAYNRNPVKYTPTWQPNFSGGNLTVVDKVLPEMLFLIDPHWNQFPPMNSLWHSILGFAIGMFSVMAMLGNMCVIYIFLKTKSLRTPSNLYVVNLAFSDFMIMFTMAPPMIINCYNETWVFGPMMCQIYGMCGSLFGCVSIWTMIVIAFDRYNVIVKGLSATPLTNGSAVFKIFLVWLSSAIWTIVPLFGWNRYVPEGNMTACGTDYLSKGWESRSYVFLYGVWVYFLPLLMIMYAYYYILKAVGKHEKNMREQAKKMNVASLRSEKESSKNIEYKLAKIALMTISLWFMAWTPYLIINFAGIFDVLALTPVATIWGSVFAKANAIYNPIVYGISHPKYRAALVKTFPSLGCGEVENSHELRSTVSDITAIPNEEISTTA
ncbi:CLUMA_CG011147, isoform A [Clunio marinus]|uniref:CLUMA_CG011147, isoform A n=1 Tax=Clunio marinus TaxID=568069 RepID=A0A1J1IBV6_9DIPT|nr:CLUMA_CG011147, isoform A [Clunio marinus]